MTRRFLMGILVLILLFLMTLPAQAVRQVPLLYYARKYKHDGEYQKALKFYLGAQSSEFYIDAPITGSAPYNISGIKALYEIRKEIIDFVRSLGVSPNVPEKAKRLMAEGRAIAETSGGREDYNRALRALRKAALLAPWAAKVHYNIGLIADKAGAYDEADYALRTYLHATPDAPDASKIKEFLYLIRARAKEAERKARNMPAAVPLNLK